MFSETLRLNALTEGASVMERTLRHLRLPTEVLTPRARAASPEVSPPVVRLAPCGDFFLWGLLQWGLLLGRASWPGVFDSFLAQA